MKYIKWLSFLTLLLFVGNTKSGTPTKVVKIQEMLCYEDFSVRGYTTMGAVGHFNDLKKDNIKLKKISSQQTTAIEQIMVNTRQRKHYQTKLGIRNIFTLIKFEGVNDTSKVVIGVGPERAVINDLSRFIKYNVTDSTDVKWLNKFYADVQL